MNVTEQAAALAFTLWSVQLFDSKLPEPLLVKAFTIIVGVPPDPVTVMVHVDADPTVTGLVHPTVVVDGVDPAANTGANETNRQMTVNDKATEMTIDPKLKPILSPHLGTQVRVLSIFRPAV